MVLGHEASGVVTEVGEGVKDQFKVGDRVCMEPGVPDPNSRESRLGMYNLCRELRFWATPPADYAVKLKKSERCIVRVSHLDHVRRPALGGWAWLYARFCRASCCVHFQIARSRVV